MAALSHRAVENRAGLTHGSTTYHFKTKDALITAMLTRLVERESEAVQHSIELANKSGGRADGAVKALEVVTASIRGDREMTLARMELFLYAARRPELQDVIATWRQKYVDLAVPVFASMGAKSPESAARFVMSVADGIELHQLSAPSSVLDSALPAIHAAAVSAGISLPSAT